MSFQERMKKMQEQPETEGVGKKWTPEEETLLVAAIKSGKDIEHIAKEHKRNPGGIRARLKRIAVRMIQVEGNSVDDVCKMLHLTSAAVGYAKTPSSRQHTESKETQLDLLKQIRDLLVRIEAKLNVE